MTAAPVLLHHLAGEPDPIESMARLLQDEPGVCAVCTRQVGRTADADRALGANFTDRSIFRAPSSRVCVACLSICSGKPPATWRMWSVVAIPGAPLPPSNPKAWIQDVGGLYLGARGGVTGSLVHAVLASPPGGDWLVTVATSGQKHVVPYADVQHGPGPWAVRMETVTVHGDPTTWAHVHTHTLALRRLGVPADDITTGTCPPWALRGREAISAWRTHSDAIRDHLGSPLLSLALWTITKEHLA